MWVNATATAVPPTRRSSPAADEAARASAVRTRDHSPSVMQLGLGWFPEHPGGLDRYYYELLAALADLGMTCSGLVVGSPAAAAVTGGRVRAFAGETSSLPHRLLAVRAAVRDAVRRREIDLLVSHFALYAAGTAGASGQVPTVVHFHGPWSAESRAEGGGCLACWGKLLLERGVYRRASRLICLSQAFAAILQRDYRIPAGNVRVIPGGVDAKRFDLAESRNDARHRLGWATDRPTVLCVRRLVRRMGLSNLIEAAAMLRRHVPDALVLIAGRGPLQETLRAQIAGLELAQTVKLLGYLPDADLPLAYRAADVTIVPSIALEGFGLAAAESLAAGTPALVTPVGGLPEVVRPLAAQWVLDGSATTQLADRLIAALRGNLGGPSARDCAAYVRAAFDWPTIAARVRAVYAEALGA